MKQNSTRKKWSNKLNDGKKEREWNEMFKIISMHWDDDELILMPGYMECWFIFALKIGSNLNLLCLFVILFLNLNLDWFVYALLTIGIF